MEMGVLVFPVSMRARVALSISSDNRFEAVSSENTDPWALVPYPTRDSENDMSVNQIGVLKI